MLSKIGKANVGGFLSAVWRRIDLRAVPEQSIRVFPETIHAARLAPPRSHIRDGRLQEGGIAP